MPMGEEARQKTYMVYSSINDEHDKQHFQLVWCECIFPSIPMYSGQAGSGNVLCAGDPEEVMGAVRYQSERSGGSRTLKRCEW